LSALFYAEARLDEGAQLALAPEHEERGAYVVDGGVSVDGEDFPRGRLLVFRPAVHIVIKARTPARLMLLGGQTLGPRHIWWNFVSSSRERIEQAKQDWKAGRFGVVPDDPEFVPLPEERKPAVDHP